MNAQIRVMMPDERKYIEIPMPVVAPTGWEVDTPSMVEEVWDAFVKPSQSDDAPPQSVEMRMLMAILRSVYDGLYTLEGGTTDEEEKNQSSVSPES